MLRSVGRERQDSVAQARQELRGTCTGVGMQQRAKALFSELFPLDVGRFQDAIGKQHQVIIRLQADNLGLVLRFGENAQDHTPFRQLSHRAVSMK